MLETMTFRDDPSKKGSSFRSANARHKLEPDGSFERDACHVLARRPRHLEKGGEEGQIIRTVEGPIRRAKGGKKGNEGGKVKGKTQGNPIARNNWVKLGARVSNPFNPCP